MRFLKAFLLALLLANQVEAQILYSGLPTCMEDATPSASNFDLDSADDAQGWVYQMPEAATITQACYRYGARTGTPPTYRISLQGVSTGAIADGTVLGGGSPAQADFTPPANSSIDDTWVCHNLANSIALTRGQQIALDIRHQTGTINGSNKSSFTTYHTSCTPSDIYGIHSYRVTDGTPAAQVQRYYAFALKSASKTYGMPALNIERTSFSSDSNPDEYGMAFTIGAEKCESMELSGAKIAIRNGATGKTLKVSLYTGTTELDTVTITSDKITSTGQGGINLRAIFTDATLDSLDCSAEYIIAIAPQETSSDFALYTVQSNAAAELGAWGYGTAWYLVTRNNGGAWSTSTTRRPMMGLFVHSVTGGSGGGVTAKRTRFNSPFN